MMERASGGPDGLFANQIITYDELAARIRVPRRTLERYVSKKEIPHNKIGRHVRFYWPAIVEWLQHTGGAKRR